MKDKKQKRILWLLKHPFACESVVSLLDRLGFEIYVPRVKTEGQMARRTSSASTYNKKLTIEQNLLDALDRFDFFSKPWPKSLSRKINKNFGIAIAQNDSEMIEKIAESFNGLIFLRVFGLAEDMTYAKQFEADLSEKAFRQLKFHDNIWLAVGYDIVIDNEPYWLRRKSIHLPQGLPKIDHKIFKWNGSSNQVLYIHPDNQAKQAKEKAYREFKDSFAEIPHVILENNPQDMDPMDRETYLELLKTSRVLYYPSTDPHHLHAYVLDALACGLPVLFMTNGLLEYLAKQRIAGCCGSLEEAREKINTILNGDQSLLSEIQSSQKTLLNAFDSKYIENCWRTRFIPVVERFFRQPEIQEKAPQNLDLSHIGIWMHVHIPGCLTGEGISHLIAMIIRGAHRNEKRNIKIHIASVTWIKEDVIEFLDNEGIDTDKIEFDLVGNTPPFLYRIYHWWINRKPKVKKKTAFWKNFERLLKELINDTVGSLLTVRTIPGLVFLILALILFSPVIITIAGLYLLVFLLRNIPSWTTDFLKTLFPIKKSKEYIQKIRKKINEISPTIYHRMLDMELRQLAEKVGRDDRFKAWFFAYPNNKYLDQFTSPRVVAVPDVVYLDFPSLYSKNPFRLIDHPDNHISQTISNADTVITFSEYIRENHVIKPGYQPAEHVHVIPHAPIDKCDVITARKEISDFELQFISRQIIKKYINEIVADHAEILSTYLRDIDLGEMDYIFVSSQTRPHKNHLNLIKAYQILLREKYVNQKLIFTGRFNNEIEEYIKKERIHLDVLSFNALPSKVHAAFYACANLTVAPTLFEGGFPFVFSESLSVRTPAILSDIPVVRELLTPKELENYCFDPYDVHAMVDKMSWALENHDSLLEMELKTLEKMKARTWEDVAEEYLHLLLESSTQGRKNEARAN